LDQILFNDSARGEEIAKAVRADYNPRTCVSIVRVRDDVLLGGVYFFNYTRESIHMHVAGWHPFWINRDMLFLTFDYPFNQLKVKRIFGYFPETNVDAYEFDYKVGFREVARIEGVYRHNVARIVMCLERDNCRFLNVKPRFHKSNLH